MEVTKNAKTVKLATDLALKELGCSIDDVTVKIVQEPKVGFLGIFSIGGRNATVTLTKKSTKLDVAVSYLEKLSAAMGIDVVVSAKQRGKYLDMSVNGAELGAIIGKRGQTLDALQHLISMAINKGDDPFIVVNIDAQDYRRKRKEVLELLASNVARRAKDTGGEIVLEPMNPAERRIIHAVLQQDNQVSTYSVGDEPYRNVVVVPKIRKGA